ncbi:MAG TPA: sigma-70 family RNA polymerase sigma factor [Bryobacteraceae bacterium]|jgi:RNA polymerase sigma factor (TIGR02999 family)|nr:sigma-70 family RNA polymerase sigma factor [Bryobacteraceae bacterium]
MSEAEAHGDITALLSQWQGGSETALNALTPLVYNELRRLAQSYLNRERPGHTLQGTAVVHEAYLRLIDQRQVHWRDRNHFFALSAELIRRILVDHARSKRAEKRGGGQVKISLEEGMEPPVPGDVDLIALDDALQLLARTDPQQSRIVELRYFAGLKIEETAEVLQISPATVKRDWTVAKAFIKREMMRNGKA